MDRRDFLKVITAATAFASYPAWARKFGTELALTDPTVQAMVRWFEEHFACEMGAPWAYVEQRPPEYEEHVTNLDWWHAPSPDNRITDGFTPYATYRVVAPNERQAVEAVWQMFAERASASPEIIGTPLYWRLPEKIQIKGGTQYRYSGRIATHEQVQDQHYTFAGEIDDLIRDGKVFDDPWTDAYYSTRTAISFVTLRMRLAVPEMIRLGMESPLMHQGWTLHTEGQKINVT